MTTEYKNEHDLSHVAAIYKMKKEQELTEKYPYKVKVPVVSSNHNGTWFERWHWCGENFTKETYRFWGHHFHFQHEQDAVFFALKWS